MERSQCVWKGVREIRAVCRTQIPSLRIWWETWIDSDPALHSRNYWKKNSHNLSLYVYSLLPPNINSDHHSLGSYYVPGTDYLRHSVVFLHPELRVLSWAPFSIDRDSPQLAFLPSLPSGSLLAWARSHIISPSLWNRTRLWKPESIILIGFCFHLYPTWYTGWIQFWYYQFILEM